MTDLNTLSTQALQDLLNNLASAKAFALEQAPDICQQMVRLALLSPLPPLVGALLLAVVFAVLLRFFRKETALNEGSEKTFFLFLAVMVSGATAAVLLCMTADASVAAWKAYIAPKVYLLEQLKTLLK